MTQPTIYAEGGGTTLICGDVLDSLALLDDQSVQMCVTSPPYYGLRDYGTGKWLGGEVDHDHKGDQRWYTTRSAAVSSSEAYSEAGPSNAERLKRARWREGGQCECGAIWEDGQIGLEQTPDEYVAKMVAVFREVKRVLRDDGTLWLNIGDSAAGSGKGPSNSLQSLASQLNRGQTQMVNGQAPTKWLSIPREPRDQHGAKVDKSDTNRGSRKWNLLGGKVPPGMKPKDIMGIPWMLAFALRADGWYLRKDIIWDKPNPMRESVKDRPSTSHEYVFLLAKSRRYFYDWEAIAEPCVTEDGVRNKGSVWRIKPSRDKRAHFAQFPPELPTLCIKAGSSVGSVVLDPFGGSGTVAEVARGLGRESILIDLNPDYCQLAAGRLGLTPLLEVAA